MMLGTDLLLDFIGIGMVYDGELCLHAENIMVYEERLSSLFMRGIIVNNFEFNHIFFFLFLVYNLHSLKGKLKSTPTISVPVNRKRNTVRNH